MACHYIETGHTKPVVGGVYVRSLAYASAPHQCHLRSFTEATGGTTLTCGRYLVHVSIAELSHWYLLTHEDATQGPP